MVEVLGVVALLVFGLLLFVMVKLLGPMTHKYKPPARVKRQYHAQQMYGVKRYHWRIVDEDNTPVTWPEQRGVRCKGAHFLKLHAISEAKDAIDAIYKLDNPERWRNVE